MHQLYEDELFPELEFSRKQSEDENQAEDDISLDLPMFDKSEESERATSQQYQR